MRNGTRLCGHLRDQNPKHRIDTHCIRRADTCALAFCAAATMALDTSELRTGWLCISVGIASQHKDRNHRVSMMLGTSLNGGRKCQTTNQRFEAGFKLCWNNCRHQFLDCSVTASTMSTLTCHFLQRVLLQHILVNGGSRLRSLKHQAITRKKKTTSKALTRKNIKQLQTLVSVQPWSST